MRVSRSSDRRRSDRRGAAATELALILPLLMLIILGCVDFGRFSYDLIAVTNAARAGAGYGVMNNFSSSTLSTWKAGVIAAAQKEIAGQDAFSLSDLTVTVPDPTIDANRLRRVSVTVTYQFRTIVSWNWPLLNIPQVSTLSRTVELRMIR